MGFLANQWWQWGGWVPHDLGSPVVRLRLRKGGLPVAELEVEAMGTHGSHARQSSPSTAPCLSLIGVLGFRDPLSLLRHRDRRFDEWSSSFLLVSKMSVSGEGDRARWERKRGEEDELATCIGLNDPILNFSNLQFPPTVSQNPNWPQSYISFSFLPPKFCTLIPAILIFFWINPSEKNFFTL